MLLNRQSCLLILSTLLGSWLGMQAAHESGHVAGAWVTGGSVERVVLHPLSLSRTDLARNPQPLAVVWAGPAVGVLLPLIAWGVAAVARWRGAFVLRFFAGFCLVANGAYLGFGAFGNVGDCGVMLRHGSAPWHLWLFGAVAMPLGLALWHRQGAHFGLPPSDGRVDRATTITVAAVAAILLLTGTLFGGR